MDAIAEGLSYQLVGEAKGCRARVEAGCVQHSAPCSQAHLAPAAGSGTELGKGIKEQKS